MYLPRGQGVRVEIHGEVRDVFLWRAEGAFVWAYVITFASGEMLEFVDSGVGAVFGGDAK
jgi:hypothetical protein